MRYASWMDELGEGFIGEMLKAAQNPKMISFAGGLPALELFPDQALQRCFQRVFEEQGKRALQYSQTAGHPPLRQWLAQQHNRHGKPVTMEENCGDNRQSAGLKFGSTDFS